ncbi:MAG: hypothetical protein HYY17_10175 [Planctomycetes bacterium]|nr:hypothetical protein [Planctomycetota bacterium]
MKTDRRIVFPSKDYVKGFFDGLHQALSSQGPMRGMASRTDEGDLWLGLPGAWQDKRAIRFEVRQEAGRCVFILRFTDLRTNVAEGDVPGTMKIIAREARKNQGCPDFVA